MTNDLWRYSTETNQWLKLETQQKASPSIRSGHAMTAVGLELYVWGGRHQSESGNPYLDDLWRYSTVTNQWLQLNTAALGASPSGRINHAMTAVGSDLYLVGGTIELETTNTSRATVFDDVWRYSTVTNQWMQVESGAAAGRAFVWLCSKQGLSKESGSLASHCTHF